jgi:bla regulator protein blaR1
MTASALFAGQFFSALGWALFHFLWQGALVAGLFAALGWLLRKRTPALKYALACGALATMIALPIATAWSLANRARDRADSGAPPAEAPAPMVVSAADGAPNAIAGVDRLLPATLRNRIEALRPWTLSAWFAGVLLLSIRFLGGLVAAHRMSRRGTRPAPAAWEETLARIASRLAIVRPVRLLESTIVKVPTAIGAFRPVILFPATVFLGLPTRGLEALLAHELAHVRRHDYFVNVLQTAAETLLFYHPAVWWVSARVRAEREQCCDDMAIAVTGDARTYARALMRLEEMRGAAPTLGVAAAGGNLWKRIFRLLSQRPAETDRSAGWLAGALALTTMIVFSAAARPGPTSAWATDSIGVPLPDAVVRAVPAPTGPPRLPARAEEVAAPEEAPAAELPESVSEPEEPAIVEAAYKSEPPEAPVPPEPPESRTLDDDEIAALRRHGVTPEYVRAIAALGYERADPDDLLSLKIHGVTPKDIADMNAIFGKLSLDEHVSFKIHGVDAAYVEKLRAGGDRQLSADDAISAKIHGVATGDVEAWSRLGYAKVSLEDLVAARIHGASPEFAAEVRSLGFSGLTLDDLVAFRIHGVTVDFLRQLRSLGYSPPAFSADDAVAFRVHGVTSEFVRQIRSLGYSDASADDLVGLRVHGISAEDVRRTNARAGRQISLDDVIDRHDCGKEKDDES